MITQPHSTHLLARQRIADSLREAEQRQLVQNARRVRRPRLPAVRRLLHRTPTGAAGGTTMAPDISGAIGTAVSNGARPKGFEPLTF
jgi:hypothetical protein